MEPALETTHPPSEREGAGVRSPSIARGVKRLTPPDLPTERQLPDDDRDGRPATRWAKGVRVRPPTARGSGAGLSAQPPSPAADPEREALIDDAIALFGPRYRRVISREEARQMTERLTAFFSLLADWDRRQRGELVENDRAA